MYKITVPENPYDAALPADADFASLLLEELRAAQELSQRVECLEHTRARSRSVRPAPGTLRANLVRRMRRLIAENAYLNEQRLDIAIEQLVEAEILCAVHTGKRKAAG